MTRRLLPADRADQPDRERREDELPGGAGGRSEAERHRAILGRQELAESRQHDVEGATRETEADQHAGRHVEGEGSRGDRHQGEAGRVEEDPDRQHPHCPEAVGDGPHERLPDAPEQVLQGKREGVGVAAPAIGADDRRLEEAERRARPEGQHRREAAARDNYGGRAPANRGGL